MAAPAKGEIALEFEGVSYTMRLDFNALAEFEGIIGGRALDVLQRPDQMSVTQVRALFWAGLSQCHPEITLQDAGRILTVHKDRLGDALAATFPAAAAEGNGKPGGKTPRQSKAS